ncbi:SPOR domain-containing protein [Spongorhabdus nitratireducens]
MRWFFLLSLVANIVFFMMNHAGYLEQNHNPESNASLPDTLGGQKLLLLSESLAVKEITEEQIVTEARAPEWLPDQSDQNTTEGEEVNCVWLGPLADDKEASQLQQRLFVISIPARIIDNKIETSPDYWVYMKPLVNRDEAARLRKELHAKKIDSFVINEGDLRNGLSLGLFSREQAAKKLQQNIYRAGYETDIRLVPRYRHEFWVELSEASDQLMEDKLWESLQQQFSLNEKRQNLCKGIASGS